MASQKRGYCETCQQKRLYVADKLNHPLHIILTIITGGAWGLVYGFLLVWPRKFRCVECGELFSE